ncbi:uncharacterized protein P884DRAFT_319314 [Thermothelomyces heterothallicus CBS 202.75]|uniref:uncharacterized protein n=1 Tax=Thermothelomyces heterothallicus CBS 202.75 TaxID=1149848 RepID=UPI003742641C
MDIYTLLNSKSDIYDSPTAQRFYYLQVKKTGIKHPGPDLHIRHSTPLSRDEKIEIRALRKYCKMDYLSIAQATGKTYHQV